MYLHGEAFQMTMYLTFDLWGEIVPVAWGKWILIVLIYGM